MSFHRVSTSDGDAEPHTEAQRVVANMLNRIRSIFAATDDWLTAPEIEAIYRQRHPGGSISVRRLDEGLRYLEDKREVIQTWREGVPVWRRSARLPK